MSRAPSELISLRVPNELLQGLKDKAEELGLPYQTLIKHWLTEKLTEETSPPTLPPQTAFVYLPTRRRIVGRPATTLVDTNLDDVPHRRRER